MTYPMVTYDGHVRYFTEFCDIADACENLTLKVDAIGGNEQVPVAFDMEWPYEPSTDTSGKTSLIQVCMDLDECFLFHLPIVRKLPASLCQFLRHPRVLLHGVNIKGDLHKLEKDFKCGLNMSCVDLRSLYHEVSNSDCFYWSMEVLVKHSLKLSIDKSIRISSWDVVPLTKAQQKYAAIDVFIGQKIYNRILSMKNQHVEDMQECLNLVGPELDENGDLPGKNYLSNEMEKMMNRHEVPR